MLLTYEQLYIQKRQQHKQLILEQSTGEHYPLYQLIHDTSHTSYPKRTTDLSPP